MIYFLVDLLISCIKICSELNGETCKGIYRRSGDVEVSRSLVKWLYNEIISLTPLANKLKEDITNNETKIDITLDKIKNDFQFVTEENTIYKIKGKI